MSRHASRNDKRHSAAPQPNNPGCKERPLGFADYVERAGHQAGRSTQPTAAISPASVILRDRRERRISTSLLARPEILTLRARYHATLRGMTSAIVLHPTRTPPAPIPGISKGRWVSLIRLNELDIKLAAQPNLPLASLSARPEILTLRARYHATLRGMTSAIVLHPNPKIPGISKSRWVSLITLNELDIKLDAQPNLPLSDCEDIRDVQADSSKSKSKNRQLKIQL